jgi:hypothetical protein
VISVVDFRLKTDVMRREKRIRQLENCELLLPFSGGGSVNWAVLSPGRLMVEAKAQAPKLRRGSFREAVSIIGDSMRCGAVCGQSFQS